MHRIWLIYLHAVNDSDVPRRRPGPVPVVTQLSYNFIDGFGRFAPDRYRSGMLQFYEYYLYLWGMCTPGFIFVLASTRGFTRLYYRKRTYYRDESIICTNRAMVYSCAKVRGQNQSAVEAWSKNQQPNENFYKHITIRKRMPSFSHDAVWVRQR